MPVPTGYYATDPRQMSETDRQRAAAYAQEIWGRYLPRMGTKEAEEAYYQQAAHGLYDPLIAGGGGYTPEEMTNILREEDLAGLQLTPQELERMHYSPEEQAAIMGDLDAERAYFNPAQQQAIHEQALEQQRGKVGQIEGYVSPELRSDPRYRDYLAETAGAAGQGYYDTITGAQAGYGEAIDPTRLGLSEQFQAQYGMTPEEVDAYAEQAGRSVRARFAGTQDELARRMAMSGAGALGEGAMREKFERTAAAEAADAITDARLKAEMARRGLMSEQERMRLGAEQDISGRRMAATGAIGGMGMEATGSLADIRQRGATAGEQARMAGEQAYAGAGMRAGEIGLGAEQYGERAGQDVARDIRDFGAGQQRYIEAQRAARAGGLADVRRGVEQYAAGQRYGRGMDINEALSRRYRDAAQERLGAGREARGWLTGQQQYAGRGYETAGQQQLAGTQAFENLAQGGTRTATQYDIARRSRPGVFSQILGTAVGAAPGIISGNPAAAATGGLSGWQQSRQPAPQGGRAEGGVITKPTYALLGESGPEAIVPLKNYAAGGMVRRPTFARLGEAGPEAVVPMRDFQTQRPASGWSARQGQEMVGLQSSARNWPGSAYVGTERPVSAPPAPTARLNPGGLSYWRPGDVGPNPMGEAGPEAVVPRSLNWGDVGRQAREGSIGQSLWGRQQTVPSEQDRYQQLGTQAGRQAYFGAERPTADQSAYRIMPAPTEWREPGLQKGQPAAPTARLTPGGLSYWRPIGAGESRENTIDQQGVPGRAEGGYSNFNALPRNINEGRGQYQQQLTQARSRYEAPPGRPVSGLAGLVPGGQRPAPLPRTNEYRTGPPRGGWGGQGFARPQPRMQSYSDQAVDMENVRGIWRPQRRSPYNQPQRPMTTARQLPA